MLGKSKKKKQTTKKSAGAILSGIVFLVMGIFFFIMNFRDYRGLNGDLLNLNAAAPGDLKEGAYVEVDITYADYSFCEMVETTNLVFKKTTDQYYLIETLTDDSYYMGIQVAESKKTDLENLSDYTWGNSDTNPGTLHYTGKLVECSDEIQGYMEDWVYDMYESGYGYTLSSEDKATLDGYIIPYYIQVMYPGSLVSIFVVSGIFIVIGLVCIVVGIISKKNTVVLPDVQTVPYDGTAFSTPSSFDTASSSDGSVSFSSTFTNNSNFQPSSQSSAQFGFAQSETSSQPYSPNDANGLDPNTFK